MTSFRLQSRGSHARCALCHSGADAEMLTCAGCGSAAHFSCASEWGRGCPSVGCRRALSQAAPALSPRPALRPRPVSPWSLGALLISSYVLASLGVRWVATGAPLRGWALLIVLLELGAVAAVLLEERERLD
ncbi:MAG TPA: hypothetical protein DEA08_26170 [Planctomycetes bacterium]|nr:hypothetical protein [Planctomycetota bacterium]